MILTLNALFKFYWLFSKPLRPNVFFQGVLSLCLLLSSCYLFVFLSLYFSTSTANILFYELYLMIFRLRLGCKKKLVVFRWANSNLDGAVLKTFWCQIWAITFMTPTTTPVPDITVNSICVSNCFSNSNSNCFSNCFAWERVLFHLYSLIFLVYYSN